MKYLITGGCGFVGSNLAEEVLRRKEKLFILDNLSRMGSSDNLSWLQEKADFEFINQDIRDSAAIEHIIQKIKPDVVFHLAGQVAMTTSLLDPRSDFEINVMGGINLLEALRKYCPEASVIYSSTNKVYGDLEALGYVENETRYLPVAYPAGFTETLPLNFRTPYGCSKGAADQYMLDYARMFGLKTAVLRHSSIYGGRQFSTIDQGWVGWFIAQALKTAGGHSEKFTISGNGKQVRDLLYVSDLVACYFQVLTHMDQCKGEAFNIGGGINNSLSLLELFTILENELKTKLRYEARPWRESDQKFFVADTTKAASHFNWRPQVACLAGLRSSIAWVKSYEQ